MNVLKYYEEKINAQGAMLFSLIDPDKLYGEKALKVAKASEEQGADAILVGGSIGAQGSVLDETVKLIKESISLPVVLYPGNVSGLTKYADAVYFMRMLNSADVYWHSIVQIQGAPVVQRMGLQAIPTTYVIIEPGRTVGWIGNANLLPRDRPDLGAACALAAKFSGSKVLITDSGSGAPSPAPLNMISAIAKACGKDLFYFYGGGVKTPQQAEKIIEAGAMGIQIGNAFEEGRLSNKIERFSKAIRKAGKKRI